MRRLIKDREEEEKKMIVFFAKINVKDEDHLLPIIGLTLLDDRQKSLSVRLYKNSMSNSTILFLLFLTII